jgi:hypothetical protein
MEIRAAMQTDPPEGLEACLPSPASVFPHWSMTLSGHAGEPTTPMPLCSRGTTISSPPVDAGHIPFCGGGKTWPEFTWKPPWKRPRPHDLPLSSSSPSACREDRAELECLLLRGRGQPQGLLSKWRGDGEMRPGTQGSRRVAPRRRSPCGLCRPSV